MDLATGIDSLRGGIGGKPLEGIEISVDEGEKQLVIDYQPRTGKAFFDVCDMGGNVKHSHRMTAVSTTTWSYDRLPRGNYLLIVVDGEYICRHKFRI